MTVAVSLLLVALVAGSATAQPDGSIAVAPYSVWTDAKHGWSVDHQGSEVLRTKNGGRTWPAPVFIGGNYVFDLVRTSRRAALVESGNWSGYTMWTNDGGSHWFETSAFPRADYYGGALGLVRAGRGRLLFWHQHGSALYRVNGWPPRGSFGCTRSSHWPNELPNHPICDQPPGDAGLSSVEVARLDAGRFGPMAAFTDGVAALVIGGPNVAQSARLALIRGIPAASCGANGLRRDRSRTSAVRDCTGRSRRRRFHGGALEIRRRRLELDSGTRDGVSSRAPFGRGPVGGRAHLAPGRVRCASPKARSPDDQAAWENASPRTAWRKRVHLDVGRVRPKPRQQPETEAAIGRGGPSSGKDGRLVVERRRRQLLVQVRRMLSGEALEVS